MKSLIRITSIALAIALLGLLLWWFQPWRLVTQSEVSEGLPTAITSTDSVEKSTPTTVESSPTEQESPQALVPTELYLGELISHEHQTTGVVRVLELEDGSRVLRLESLETSDGPDLEVWLSDAPVVEGYDGWFLADDGDYQSLGKLKATSGDQNYRIPDGLDLSRFSSMSIWCVRFSVSFGAAELELFE